MVDRGDAAPFAEGADARSFSGGSFAGHILEAELASNARSSVYRARSEHRLVALKVFSRRAGIDRAILERFSSSNPHRVRHPSLVSVESVGETDERVYYSMKYLGGDTLRRSLDDLIEGTTRRPSFGPLAVREDGSPPRDHYATAARLCAELAEGLSRAHAEGLFHGRIDPENLMFSPSGRLVLLNFDGRHAIDTDIEANRADDETPHGCAYRAPELLAGEPANARADVYGLGAVLYELVCLRAPYRSSDLDALERDAREGRCASPRSLEPDIPVDLEATIQIAIDPDPAQRYASVDEFAADLRAFLRGTVPPGVAERQVRDARESASEGDEKDELDELRDEIARLRDENSRLIDGEQRLRAKETRLAREEQIVRDDAARLEAEFRRSKEESERVRRSTEEIERRRREIEESVERLEIERSHRRELALAAARSEGDAEVRCRALEAEITAARIEGDVWRARIATLDAELANLRAEAESLALERDRAQESSRHTTRRAVRYGRLAAAIVLFALAGAAWFFGERYSATTARLRAAENALATLDRRDWADARSVADRLVSLDPSSGSGPALTRAVEHSLALEETNTTLLEAAFALNADDPKRAVSEVDRLARKIPESEPLRLLRTALEARASRDELAVEARDGSPARRVAALDELATAISTGARPRTDVSIARAALFAEPSTVRRAAHDVFLRTSRAHELLAELRDLCRTSASAGRPAALGIEDFERLWDALAERDDDESRGTLTSWPIATLEILDASGGEVEFADGIRVSADRPSGAALRSRWLHIASRYEPRRLLEAFPRLCLYSELAPGLFEALATAAENHAEFRQEAISLAATLFRDGGGNAAADAVRAFTRLGAADELAAIARGTHPPRLRRSALDGLTASVAPDAIAHVESIAFESIDRELRETAFDALARRAPEIDTPRRRRLARMAIDDPKLRPRAFAWIESLEPRSRDELAIELLPSLDREVFDASARWLIESRDPLVPLRLSMLLFHESSGLRSRSLDVLDARNDLETLRNAVAEEWRASEVPLARGLAVGPKLGVAATRGAARATALAAGRVERAASRISELLDLARSTSRAALEAGFVRVERLIERVRELPVERAAAPRRARESEPGGVGPATETATEAGARAESEVSTSTAVPSDDAAPLTVPLEPSPRPATEPWIEPVESTAGHPEIEGGAALVYP
jgi:serine/threonine protein kinase